MPKLISMTRAVTAANVFQIAVGQLVKRVTAEDKIEGSNQMARAIWALGVLGIGGKCPASGATVSRIVRAWTALNWEGPQASRFFRLNGTYAYFTRTMQENGRYLFGLSELGRAVFDATFRIPPIPLTTAPPADKPDHLAAQKEALRRTVAELGRARQLLERIYTCEHNEVGAVMVDIGRFLGKTP